MIIKTSEGEKNVASKGLGGTALGLSIGALGLELLRGNNGCGNGCGNNGGILGNLFGGNNCGNGCNTGCGCGEYDCVTPVCRPWQYEDKIICLQDRLYTNDAIACATRPLYEKIERIEKKEAYEAGYEAAKKEDVPVIECLKTKIIDDKINERVPYSHYVACGKKLVDPCFGCDKRDYREDYNDCNRDCDRK